jgi:hypothetical protein
VGMLRPERENGRGLPNTDSDCRRSNGDGAP